MLAVPSPGEGGFDFKARIVWFKEIQFITNVICYFSTKCCAAEKLLSFTLREDSCPVGWGCRIHRLLLCWGVRPPPPMNVLIYDTKESDGEVPAMLELWGMQRTFALPSLPSPLCPGVVALDRVLSMGQKELSCVLMINWTVWNRTVWLNWIVCNRTVYLYKNGFGIK